MQRRFNKRYNRMILVEAFSFPSDKIMQPSFVSYTTGSTRSPTLGLSCIFIFWFNRSPLILHEQVIHVFYHGHLFQYF